MSSNANKIVGTQKIYYAIKSRRPELTHNQVEQKIEVVLDQVAKRIGSGDALAFFHLGDDDQAEVITYSLESHKKQKG